MPWISAGAMLLMYLYHTPVVFALMWDGRGYGTGTGLFSLKSARRRAEKRMTGIARHVNYGKLTRRARKFLPVKAMAMIGARVLPRVSIEALRADIAIGTGDAALTARLAGAITAFLCAVGAFSRQSSEIRVAPDFSERAIRGHISAVFSLRVGDVAAAAWGYFRSAKPDLFR